jgi:hypothetical protein
MDATNPTQPKYLTPDAVAEATGIGPHTLRRLRCVGGGPPYRKVGRRCLYEYGEVLQWIEAHKVSTTAEHATRGAQFHAA